MIRFFLRLFTAWLVERFSDRSPEGFVLGLPPVQKGRHRYLTKGVIWHPAKDPLNLGDRPYLFDGWKVEIKEPGVYEFRVYERWR